MASTREVESELKRRVAYLPGGHDRSGLPIIIVPIDSLPPGLCGAGAHHGGANHLPSDTMKACADADLNDSFDSESRLSRTEEERCLDLDRVLRYLLPIALACSPQGTDSVIVLMDARQGCWRLLRAATEQAQITLTNSLAAIWALKPEPFWEKQHVECMKSRPDCAIQYLSLPKLHKLIGSDQLPEELGGQLPYQHKQWVKNRFRLETFSKRSQTILNDLEDAKNQLDRGCTLIKSEGGFRMIDWMLSLCSVYRKCLASVRKVEQKGKKLYKLLDTDEESGFRMARPDGSVTIYTLQCQQQVQEALASIQRRVGEAEQLYTELNCGIEHAKEVQRLEAGVESVTSWVLGTGADLLRQLILRGIGQDPDSVLSLQQELENLEMKCRETYAKYAELRHRLGYLFRSRCILPNDMKARRSFMDSVCRTFAGLLERRRRVLITSYKFHRLLVEFHAKLSDALRAVQNLQVGEDPAKAENGLTILDNYQQSIDALCAEAESEAQRLLDLLVLPPRDAVGRELQGYDHRRERQTVQFLLRRVQDGQARLQQAWNMERLRLRRIVEISTCERDSQQSLAWLSDLCNVIKTSRARVGCSQEEVQSLKQQQSKFQETARGAYEYGVGLLMAALVLRRSAGLPAEQNRQLATQLGTVWKRLVAAIREQMTRLRVASLFYRDISQHESDLGDLVSAGNQGKWREESQDSLRLEEAEHVFRVLGRTIRLGRLLQRKILEPLLPGDGSACCPDNKQAVQVINEKISRAMELAQRLEATMGNRLGSYVDTYIADDSLLDMQDVDVDIGFDEANLTSLESSFKEEDTSKVSCYQSASSDCSWASREGFSPRRPKPLEQLDMKPMDDFRDYVNYTPSTGKLFLHTSVTSSSGGSTSGGSIGGLSPNTSEDSGFGTGLRVFNAAKSRLFVKPDEPAVPISATLVNKTLKLNEALWPGSPKFRSSICYARSASCDSLF